jgi:hypothetical protein
LVRVADDLRMLRADLNELALVLLNDDNGISEDAYVRLRMLFDRVGGMPELNVDATDGRWYIPNRSM